MIVVLAALNTHLADAWAQAFEGAEDVKVHHGSIFETHVDALVSPANSFGFMDGGIDAFYSQRFGWDLQNRLRWQILKRHEGELLVGAAELVTTGNAQHPYLIAAPTMRVPMVLDERTVSPFLATRAALLLLKKGSFYEGGFAGQQISDHVRSVAFPGMGTGVGRVAPKNCARQMRAAYDEFAAEKINMPASWAEASERHQLLYTNSPTRLQY